jgi:hypothetical protein
LSLIESLLIITHRRRELNPALGPFMPFAFVFQAFIDFSRCHIIGLARLC